MKKPRVFRCPHCGESVVAHEVNSHGKTCQPMLRGEGAVKV